MFSWSAGLAGNSRTPPLRRVPAVTEEAETPYRSRPILSLCKLLEMDEMSTPPETASLSDKSSYPLTPNHLTPLSTPLSSSSDGRTPSPPSVQADASGSFLTFPTLSTVLHETLGNSSVRSSFFDNGNFDGSPGEALRLVRPFNRADNSERQYCAAAKATAMRRLSERGIQRTIPSKLHGKKETERMSCQDSTERASNHIGGHSAHWQDNNDEEIPTLSCRGGLHNLHKDMPRCGSSGLPLTAPSLQGSPTISSFPPGSVTADERKKMKPGLLDEGVPLVPEEDFEEEEEESEKLTGLLIEDPGYEERTDRPFAENYEIVGSDGDGDIETESGNQKGEVDDRHKVKEGTGGGIIQEERPIRYAEITNRARSTTESRKSGATESISQLSTRNVSLKNQKRTIEAWNEFRRSRLLIKEGNVVDVRHISTVISPPMRPLERRDGPPSRIGLDGVCADSCAGSTLSSEIRPLYSRLSEKKSNDPADQVEGKTIQRAKREGTQTILPSIVSRENAMRTVNEEGPFPLSPDHVKGTSTTSSNRKFANQNRRLHSDMSTLTPEPMDPHWTSQPSRPRLYVGEDFTRAEANWRKQQRQCRHPAATVNCGERCDAVARKVRVLGGRQCMTDVISNGQQSDGTIKKNRELSARQSIPSSGRRGNLSYRKQAQVKQMSYRKQAQVKEKSRRKQAQLKEVELASMPCPVRLETGKDRHGTKKDVARKDRKGGLLYFLKKRCHWKI